MQNSVKTVTKKLLELLNLVPLSSYKYLEASVQHQLSIAEKTLDFQFRTFMRDYVETVVLPRATRVRKRDYAHKTYTKTARRRFLPVNAKTGYQNFILELDCLSRINEAVDEQDLPRHFPVLVDFDPDKLTITCSHDGESLEILRKPVHIPNPAAQIRQITETLAQARIKHLDMHPSGKNLLVDPKGRLTVVDFDMAQVDGLSLSSSVDERLANDEMVLTGARILAILQAQKYITLGVG